MQTGEGTWGNDLPSSSFRRSTHLTIKSAAAVALKLTPATTRHSCGRVDTSRSIREVGERKGARECSAFSFA